MGCLREMDEVIGKLRATMFTVVFNAVLPRKKEQRNRRVHHYDVIHQPSEDEWVGIWALDRSIMDTIVAEIMDDDAR